MAGKDKPEPPTATPAKRKPPKSIQVPRDLFFTARDALRAVGKDTRGKDDRALTNETIEQVNATNDALEKWQDSKL